MAFPHLCVQKGTNQKQRDTVGYNGIQWDIMALLGIPWDIMRIRWDIYWLYLDTMGT